MFAALLILAASASEAQVVPLDPNKMTLEQIRTHNQAVGAGSPDYIRCRKFTTTGSLARTVKLCRTAREWAAADATGNQEAQDIVRKWQQSEGSHSLEDPNDVGPAIGPGNN